MNTYPEFQNILSSVTLNEFFKTLIAIAGVIATLMVLRATTGIERAHYARSIQDIWNTINVTVLAQTELLPLVRSVENPWIPRESLFLQRKRFLSHLYLNALESTFLGMKQRMINRKASQQTLNHILDPLLADPYIFALTQNSGYDPRFSRYCEKRRKKLKNSNDKFLLQTLILDDVFIR